MDSGVKAPNLHSIRMPLVQLLKGPSRDLDGIL